MPFRFSRFPVLRQLLLAMPLAASLSQAAVAAESAITSYDIHLQAYFADAATEAQDLLPCQRELEHLRGERPDSGASLLGYLQSADALLSRGSRHLAYWKVVMLRDTEDVNARRQRQAWRQIVIQTSAAVDATLASYGLQRFEKDAAATAGLAQYRYLMESTVEDHAHGLPASEAEIAAKLLGPASDTFWSLYQQITRNAPFGKITTAAGERDVYTDAELLAVDPDRNVRQLAWERYWDGHAQRGELYATTLTGIIRLQDQMARLNHYPDAPAAKYAAAGLRRADVDAALALMQRYGSLNKRLQQLRAQRVASDYGIADVHVWDSKVAARGFAAPHLTLDQGLAAAVAAVKPFGPDYVQHMQALLDPANGRLDIAADKGRRASDSTAISAAGVPTGLFVELFSNGLPSQSKAIIHEGGHAVHRQYINETGNSAFYNSGPSWMMEGVANLNNFMLFDYLASTASDLATRAYYLETLLDNISFELFGSAEEDLLERQLYEGVLSGNIKTAADMDALTLRILKQFEIWPEKDRALQHTWMHKRLFFNDPLYLADILYSGLFAVKMFDMVQADPQDFQQRHQRLLREGFSAPPQQIMQRFFGRDISQQELIEGAMRSFESKLQALEETYRQMDAKS